MMSFEKRMLHQLLDSYEKSSLSRGENKVAVHISFAFQKKNVPEYFDESSMAYEDIHAIIRQLEKRGFIAIIWKNKKENHIIEKVMLREEALSEIYRYVNRIPKSSQEQTVTTMLSSWQEQDITPVLATFLVHMQERISEGKSVKEYMDISKPGEIEELFRAVNLVERNTQECFIREFSIRYFHDSKKFEGLIGKVCKIMREERLEFDAMENDEILAEYQIYHTPGYVYLKGNVHISIGASDELVSVGSFPNGLGFGLDRTLNHSFEIVAETGQIQRIYTIENLTTFFRFEQDNSLIIYLGGYHNTIRRNLLIHIYETFPEASYYHFGDIDAGGFQIFYHLKEKTGIPFQMYRMDLMTLKRYQEYGKPLTENDRKRLRYMLNQKIEESQKEIIAYMLEENVKLEQECIVE